jgi:hypothetical protein
LLGIRFLKFPKMGKLQLVLHGVGYSAKPV